MNLQINRTPDSVKLDDRLMRQAIREFVERQTSRQVSSIDFHPSDGRGGRAIHATVTLLDPDTTADE